MRKSKLSKMLSFLLCFVMVATSIGQMTSAAFAVESADAQLCITEDGEEVSETFISKNGNTVLSVEGASGDVQWQYYAKDYDLWISIFGETEEECSLTYAKVCNMLDDEQQTKIRCIQKDGADVIESNEVVLSVIEMEEAASYPMMRAAAPARNNAASEAAEEGEKTTFNVVINYVFTNGEIAADTYTASLAKGSNFSTTVTFPTVQGYLPYVGEADEPSENIELNITNIQEDVTYTVTYKPTNVDYTVIHYQQNLDNDNYTEVARETKQGLTGSTVPEVAKIYFKDEDNDGDKETEVVSDEAYRGFYSLVYEKPNIAADGSTVVEVYYDRYYYLMNFELVGGYGVEPRYAKYGTHINDIGIPEKAGYVFKHWELDNENATIPSTMPSENRTYTAVWEEGEPVNYTIVYWKENPNDSNYSYWGSEPKTAVAGTNVSGSDSVPSSIHNDEKKYFTFNAEKTDKNVSVKGDGSTIINVYYTRNTYTLTFETNELICETEAHEHDDSCNGCGVVEHTHSHSTCCTKDTIFGYHSGDCNTAKCPYGGTEHTHSDICYTCGKSEHSHTAGDYWTESCYGSNKIVKTITAKYQQDIRRYFPIIGTNNANYAGYWWEVPSGATFFKPETYVVSIDTMPGENLTFTGSYYGVDAKIKYYVESLDGKTGVETYDGKQFDLYKTVITENYGSLTYLEEFHNINGFTQWKSDPAFSSYDKNGTVSVEAENNMYYTRNDYQLKYYNYNTYLTDSEKTVQYEASLNEYNVTTPKYPDKLEKDAYYFEGWYTTEKCLEGTKLDFTNAKMPASDLTLYANWRPVVHTVEFYLDRNSLNSETKLETHEDMHINHGEKVDPVPAEPRNGSYTFIGWFYLEDGIEKAFDFENMPVRKDLKVYAKWSSNVLKNYTVNYVYINEDGNEIPIAEQTTGSGLAGVTKTFDAKGGAELYADYQEGYFPVVKSHSMTIDINATEENDTNVYTFEYVQKDAVPYTVYYVTDEQNEDGTLAPIELYGETYYIVADTYTNTDNRKAVVTETFAPVGGYLPDAYQKRLVVDGSEGAVNEIIFYYTADTEHAYYKITHYTENLAKDADGNTTWTEYASSQAVGDIGDIYTADELTINGFTYNPDIEGTLVEGELTANGLELKLYYTRNEYPYQVRYLEEGTGKQLAEPKDGKDKYGQIISESAIDIENYTAVDPTSQTLNIRIETDDAVKLNIITFYYEENEVQINYQVVGPTGCGTVTPTSETPKVVSGEAQGSTASVSGDNYRFMGWYKDAACTELLTDDIKYVPAKVDGKNVAATYYAKFEYALTSLTIKKDGINEIIDPYQTTLFRIIGTDLKTQDVDLTVSVIGNGEITIEELPVGDYKIEEVLDWAARYDIDDKKMESAIQNITLTYNNDGTAITFFNKRVDNNWLDYNTSVDNKFSSITKVND